MWIIQTAVGKGIQEWQLVPFAWQFPCQFCHDSEAIPSESWHDGEWTLTKVNWPCSSQLFLIPYSENHLQRKEIPGHWGPHEEIKFCSFGCIWWLPCATFRKVYKICCSQGRLLQRKIKQLLSYFIHVCSHRPSPRPLLLEVVCVKHKELTLILMLQVLPKLQEQQ